MISQRIKFRLSLFVILINLLIIWCYVTPKDKQIPNPWKDFVRVEGQSEPIPAQWLDTEEAKITHNLILPKEIPKSVPFNFEEKSSIHWKFWEEKPPAVQVQYFNHLCKTEAGKWVFHKAQGVEGLYFARPIAITKIADRRKLNNRYDLEMPWIQRTFFLNGDSIFDQGAWLVEPPVYNFKFIEQPYQDAQWPSPKNYPYVRIFGYTRGFFAKKSQFTATWNDLTPMQAIGIDRPTAKYAYTWRGIKREKDRENNIAGGELIIYNKETKEILAVHRTFLLAPKNHRGHGDAMWEIANRCTELNRPTSGSDFSQIATETFQNK